MESSKRRRFHLDRLADTIRRWQVGLTIDARQGKLTALRRLSTLQ